MTLAFKALSSACGLIQIPPKPRTITLRPTSYLLLLFCVILLTLPPLLLLFCVILLPLNPPILTLELKQQQKDQ